MVTKHTLCRELRGCLYEVAVAMLLLILFVYIVQASWPGMLTIWMQVMLEVIGLATWGPTLGVALYKVFRR